MPNAKVLSEKQAIVAALAERIQNSGSGVLVDYKGINVAQDTELRAELRKNDVEYTVVKNTLVRFALDKVGMEGLEDVLNGTTSLATANGDPIAPFRICKEYSDKLNGVFTLKAGYMDGKAFQGSTVRKGSRNHARSHHQPGCCTGPDRGAEGRLRSRARSRCRISSTHIHLIN